MFNKILESRHDTRTKEKQGEDRKNFYRTRQNNKKADRKEASNDSSEIPDGGLGGVGGGGGGGVNAHRSSARQGTFPVVPSSESEQERPCE